MAEGTLGAGGNAGLPRNPIQYKNDGELEAPDNVVPSVGTARALYYQYRQSHLKRIQLYAGIEGLIAGNPPYDPAELAAAGLGHIANFNNLDGRSFYERSALAYWNLVTQAESICKFEVVTPVVGDSQAKADNAQTVKYAQKMSKHWSDVIREWPSFYTLVNTLTAQLVKFGLSAAIWPDEHDWRWRTVELNKFFVPDQASTDIGQLTTLAIETSMTVQYLWNIYEHLDKQDQAFREQFGYDNSYSGELPSESQPWNKEELGKLLVYYANSYVKPANTITDTMDLQQRIQNSDANLGPIFSDDVRIVSLFSKEYDGKITHYMFDRYHDTGEFLFKEDRQYESLTEALAIFTASPGEFTLHSNRGLGHKIFSGSQALMQLDCSLVDGARWASTILISSPATSPYDAEPIKFFPGVPTNIGTAQFQQNTLGANLDHLVGVSKHIYQKLNFNTANSGDDPGVPDRNHGSLAPEQSRMNAIREFSILKHNIAHFYSQFDYVIRNMVTKMLHSKKGFPGYEVCKEWKERCINDGVPEEMFSVRGAERNEMPRHLKVKATRVAGDGSTLGLLVAVQQMMEMFGGDFGPRESAEIKRMVITALFGAEYVKVFMQDSDNVDERAGGASLAALENNVMLLGYAPVFSPDNEQRSHIVAHMTLGKETIGQIQSGKMDPVQADRVFRQLIPHTEEHINYIKNSVFMQTFVEGIIKPWKQIRDYAELNRKNATSMIRAEQKKRQKQAEKQQEVMSDIQRKDAVAQADIKRKDIQAAAQIERNKEQSDKRGEIQAQTAQDKASVDRLKVVLDAQNKSLEAMSDAELNRERETISGRTPAPNDFESNTDKKA